MIDEGFVVQAQSVDIYDAKSEGLRSRIILWLRCKDGVSCLHIDGEQPTFFIREQDKIQFSFVLRNFSDQLNYQQVALQSFEQYPMVAVYCQNLSVMSEVKKILARVNLTTYEDDFRLHERYLMERFCYGSLAFTAASKQQLSHYRQYNDARIKPSSFKPQLKTLSLDIECSIHGELYSVGLSAAEYQTVIMIGAPEADSAAYLVWVDHETALLQTLVAHIQRFDPDVIIGWNVINFDFRILMQRAKQLHMQLHLGRDGSAASWRDSRIDANDGFITIAGRKVVDGIDALKAETYSFASFSLDHVAQQLLQQGKNCENLDNRAEEISDNFKHNKAALAAYNLQDCVLVEKIFNKTKVLEFLIFRSQLTGLPLDKRGGSVAAFTNLYLPKLHRAGYVAPNLPKAGGLASPGGYVMESRPGLYKNVIVLDFKSLYPSIIRTFKIDPLGLITGLHANDAAQLIPGFDGAVFSREQHFLPAFIQQLWQQRDIAKQAGDKAKSNAIKILMNSFYGVLGSGGCRFYDPRLASSITRRGHEIMQQTADWIKAMDYQVIYGDTDSLFVLLDESCSADQCQAIAAAICSEINQSWHYKLRQEFDLSCYLELEFETYYSRFLMPTIRGLTTGSKKRYAGLAVNGKQQHMVFKGLETVRTDWTALAKQFQMQLFDDVFHDKDPSDYIRETVFATINGQFDSLLAYRKRLRRPLHEYQKNIPPHVRAAINADQQNAELAKPLRYQHKGWIEYVITVNGPEALEYLRSDIDYEHYVIKQLKPIADAVLPFIGLSFDRLFKQQMNLFE